MAKIQVTVDIPTVYVKRLQALGRLTSGSVRDALREEFNAVIQAHIEDLESEAEAAGEDE